MCFFLLNSIMGRIRQGSSISWCHPLKLPYSDIRSIFSFSPRWCHLPKRGVTSHYGKKWCHECPYAPTQTPLHSNDVIFQNGEWHHFLGDYVVTDAPQHPLRPLSMRPVAEPPFSYYSLTRVIGDNHGVTLHLILVVEKLITANQETK